MSIWYRNEKDKNVASVMPITDFVGIFPAFLSLKLSTWMNWSETAMMLTFFAVFLGVALVGRAILAKSLNK